MSWYKKKRLICTSDTWLHCKCLHFSLARPAWGELVHLSLVRSDPVSAKKKAIALIVGNDILVRVLVVCKSFSVRRQLVFIEVVASISFQIVSEWFIAVN